MARHWGVLFQQGALFSSLTVRQNIQFPLREYLNLSDRLLDEMATAKLEMVGLERPRRRQVPGRNLGRNDQASRARPRAGARPAKSSFSTSRRPGSTPSRPEISIR